MRKSVEGGTFSFLNFRPLETHVFAHRSTAYDESMEQTSNPNKYNILQKLAKKSKSEVYVMYQRLY